MGELTSGQRVRILRGLYGASRADFSSKLNMPSSTLRNWECRTDLELPYKACNLLYRQLSAELNLSFEWLRVGLGAEPEVIIDDSQDDFDTLARVILESEEYVNTHGYNEHIIRYAPNDDWVPFVFLGDVIIGKKQSASIDADEGFSIYIDHDGLEYFGYCEMG